MDNDLVATDIDLVRYPHLRYLFVHRHKKGYHQLPSPQNHPFESNATLLAAYTLVFDREQELIKLRVTNKQKQDLAWIRLLGIMLLLLKPANRLLAANDIIQAGRASHSGLMDFGGKVYDLVRVCTSSLDMDLDLPEI